MDDLDRGILHALQLDGRAPFRRIAELLAVSEQTVARRYRQLYADGVVRVVALTDPASVGVTSWSVRIQCRPDAAGALAEALARRDDVAWVTLTSGGSEVTCSVRSNDPSANEDLLLQRLPRTTQVQTFTAYAILHRFAGGGPDWTAYATPLPAARLSRFLARRGPGPTGPPAGPEDRALVQLLAIDGRASYTDLARATGWPQARVARRMDELIGGGHVYVDVELSAGLLGFRAEAYLWLTVPPDQVVRVGAEMARLDDIGFSAVMTGPANLLCAATCRDMASLYTLTTEGIGAIGGVERLEVSPVIRRVKQAGSIMDGARLTSRPRPTLSRASR